MNFPWRPPRPPFPDQCTCGCEPCRCEECDDEPCPPEPPCPPCVDDIKECWKQVAAFKAFLEKILGEMGVVQGPIGPAGPAGPAGAQGPAGTDGTQGPAGPAGMAISYVGDTQPSSPVNGELWVKSDGSLHIYEDPPGQWVDISAGGVGTPGPQGPAGPAGAVGAQGMPGSVGPQGAQGPIGPAGPQGMPGANGQDGGASLTRGAVGTYALMSRLEDTKNGGPLLEIGSQQTNPQMFGNNTGTWQVVNYSFDMEFISNGVAGVVTYLMQRII